MVVNAVVEVAMVVVADARAAGRVALVAGATGLVGREVLAALLADKRYSQVHCLGRRAPAVQHKKLRAHLVDVTDAAALMALAGPQQVDDVYITLGTTIKVAGSQAAFRALDHDAVVAVGRMGKARAATKLGVVSAMGASAASGVFYNRVKGETEDDLAQLGYQLLVIARPSLIEGDRASLNQAGRAGEGLALKAMRLLKPLTPRNYQSIRADQIAAALVASVTSGTAGKTVLLSGQMQS